MKPRLLKIFNCYRDPGGEETFVRQLQEIIGPEQMHTVFFQSRDWTAPSGPSKWQQARLTFNNPDSVAAVMQKHEEFQPDVWMFGNLFPVGSLALYRLAHERRVPLIHFTHNFRPFSVNGTLWAGGRLCDAGLRGNFWPEIWRKSWRGSRATTALMATVLSRLRRSGWLDSVRKWITVSEFMRGKFIEAGVPPDRVVAMRPFWFATPEPPSEPEGDHYLFVGRLIPEKGISVLLEAWQQIRRERGARTPRLVIAGRGPLEEMVRAAAAGNSSVRYEGFVTDERKRQLISGCRAMIAPSVFWEPLGAVTYEAYDCAKPMLGARSGGITETILHNTTGLLHEPGNSTELARQILDLDSAANRRVEMGNAGRRWLLEQSAPKAYAQRLIEIAAQL